MGCVNKVRKMKWCLAEADRSIMRARLMRCTTMSISQDARAPYHVVRAGVATDNLEHWSFPVGQLNIVEDFEDQSAGAISMATLHIFRSLCTENRDPSFLSGGAKKTTFSKIERNQS